jgi:hypothetical protein
MKFKTIVIYWALLFSIGFAPDHIEGQAPDRGGEKCYPPPTRLL